MATEGMRVFSPSDLEVYDGVRRSVIYLAFNGRVYDVSSRRDLYGADSGGAYAGLAGRDATRSLTKMSLKPEDMGRNDIDDLLASPLGDLHAKALEDWTRRFESTYEFVGTLTPDDGMCRERAASATAKPAWTMNPLRSPGDPEVLSMKPRIHRIRGFLNPLECRMLRQMCTGGGGEDGRRAMIFSESKIREGLRVDDERFSVEERYLLSAVEARLGWLVNSPLHEDEIPLVGTLTPPTAASAERCHLGLHVDTNGGRQWRYATAICYLSSVQEGGCTVFPLARPLDEAGSGMPSDDDLALLESSQRLLDADIDHTDRVLVHEQQPLLQSDAEALVAASRRGEGVSVQAEEGTVVIFWTRQSDGSIDPYSWHGGEAVGEQCAKWTMQKFKEVPLDSRECPTKLAAFVAESRRRILR